MELTMHLATCLLSMFVTDGVVLPSRNLHSLIQVAQVDAGETLLLDQHVRLARGLVMTVMRTAPVIVQENAAVQHSPAQLQNFWVPWSLGPAVRLSSLASGFTREGQLTQKY